MADWASEWKLARQKSDDATAKLDKAISEKASDNYIQHLHETLQTAKSNMEFAQSMLSKSRPQQEAQTSPKRVSSSGF